MARRLVTVLAALDAAALLVALTVAGVARLSIEELLPLTSLSIERHFVVSLLLIPVVLALYRAQGLYDLDHILVGTREYARLAHAVTYSLVIALAISYFAGAEPIFSRSWLLLVWVSAIACGGATRFAVRRIVRRLRRRGWLRTRVVIVGASPLGIAIAQQLGSAHNEGIDVIGFLDEYVPLGHPLVNGLNVIGRPGDLLHGQLLEGVDEYIIVPEALPHERLNALTRLMVSSRSQHVVLRLVVGQTELLTNGLQLVQRGHVPLVRLEPARITGLEGVLKRGFDLILAAGALCLLSPPALAALLRAKLLSRQPLLERITLRAPGDRRVDLRLFTPAVSDWPPLRGLPALLWVLGGSLSLVGPRPVPLEGRADQIELPEPLTAIKPGLTGPWRLTGPTASLDEQALSDLTYVRNYTVWEDIRIVWESLRRLGAGYRPSVLARWRDGEARLTLMASGWTGDAG